MNEEIKAEWMEALRSGEYAQAHEVLGDTKKNAFCCLGVLCELAAAKGVVSRGVRPSGIVFYTSNDRNGYEESAVLPLPVSLWADIDHYSSNPNIYLSKDDAERVPDQNAVHYESDGQAFTTLAGLNDGGMDFSQIADVIEKYL